MLQPPGHSQYDLSFKLGNIPVRVHPSFWLIALIMGAGLNNLNLIVIWVACLFVSILIHELGHALAARYYGWPPQITLYHFGGLASFYPGYNHTPGKAIWVAFAGPAAGFVFFGVICVVESFLYPRRFDPNNLNEVLRQLQMVTARGPAGFALMQLKYINFFWGLVNLLPVYPLDGGQICVNMLGGTNSYHAKMRSHQIGMIVGGLVAAFFFSAGQFYAGLLFAGLAIQNYQSYEACRAGRW